MKSSRKYYLHRRIRALGYKVDSRKRTIFIPPLQTADNKYINELVNELKYIKQLELL